MPYHPIAKGGNREYSKIFRDQGNINQAIELINSGLSLSGVAQIMQCDHTSILALRKRLLKEGVVFVEFEKRIPITHWILGKVALSESVTVEIEFKRKRKEAEDNNRSLEEIFRPTKSYRELLIESAPTRIEAKKKLMEKAKETIKQLHEQRKANGLPEQGIDIDVY